MSFFKKYFFFFIVALMFVGMVGRLVAGSIPIPPQSPFSIQTLTVSHSASALNMAKSGKKQEHHSEAPRPWYGLLEKEEDSSPLHLVSILPVSLSFSIPTRALQPAQRPPSC